MGYYVNNEFHDPDQAAPTLDEQGQPIPVTVPNPVPLEKIQRQILANKPRVTKFPISWGDEPLPQQQQQQQAGDASRTMGAMPPASEFPSSSGIVSMQEESNTSFGGNHGGGIQAMVE